MLEIYIGPNGYGKTTKLMNIMQDLVENQGISRNDIIFLESEILLTNEMKDTTDNTKSMEFILGELIESTLVTNTRNAFENAIDSEIVNNVNQINAIVDSVMSINNQTRTKDFIKVSNKKVYKGLVKIEQTEVKNKMGSGQRMHLILELTCKSTKTHIFLDEPEKYSHPSLLHKTAELINDLSLTKNVYIASHSPKLLSMLDINLDNIKILNDNTYIPKSLDFLNVISKFNNHQSILSTDPNLSKSNSYFNLIELKKNIISLHYREFIESLFSKNIYIIEGVNDELFIKKMLQDNNKFYSDYSIFNTYGKHHMMIFAELFKSLSIDVHVYFDKDSNNGIHLSSNNELAQYPHYMFINNIERDIGYKGNKYNTVNFINYLYSINISSVYNI